MKHVILSLTLCKVFLLSFSICSAQQVINHADLKGSASEITAAKSFSDNKQSDTWYNDAMVLIPKLEYGFYATGKKDLYKVANTKNQISFELNPAGYSTKNIIQSAGQEQWNVNFKVNGIGRNKLSWKPGNSFYVVNNTGSVSYKYNDITIEYINNEKGMRQNFIVNNKPAGTGKLRVSIAVTGDLTAKLDNNRLAFIDNNDSGKVKFVYTDLKVWDANHKSLHAYMAYNKSNHDLELIVDDAKAVYPVLIDPINQTAEWSTSADGLLTGLLTSLQMKTSLYGFVVTSLGDVNGDQYSDVAISAPAMIDIFSGSGLNSAVGAVFIYYGSDTGLSKAPNKILQPNTAVAGALFGFSVAGGDITGDGDNDIIIGAPLDSYSVNVQTALLGGPPFGLGPLYGNVTVTAGKVYVFRSEDLSSGSNPSPFLQIKLDNSFFSPGLAGLLGNNITVKSLFGFSVAVTDNLNADAKPDIIIGAPSYLSTDLLSVQNGSAFVYYSNNLAAAPVQLQTPPLSLLGLVTLPVINSSGLLYGYSVDGVGDYNNDGFNDVVVGAPAGVDLSSLGGLFSGQVLGGSAYVYYGNGTGINTAIGARLQASSTGLLGSAANLFGYKVKGMKGVNDVRNGNILVGAPTGGLIPNVLSLTIQTGNAHLFLRKLSSPAGVVTANQVLESPKSSSLLQLLNTMSLNVMFGLSFDNAYDVNCDGYADLVVGEPLSSGTNISQLQTNPVGGSAYIYSGTPSGLFNPTPIFNTSATYGGEFLSVNATALLGFSVAGVPQMYGTGTSPRVVVGSPSGALDFSSSMLNLGSTLNTLFSFVAGDNGLGKAYSFDPDLCGSMHTLPAKLVSFTGRKKEKDVQLNWSTVNEINVNQFIVEKSADGINFTTLAYVFAMGNENRNDYATLDKNPVMGINYYRLKIVDKNSSFLYSQVIEVKFNEQTESHITIAPNPVVNDYKLMLEGLEKGNYTVEIRSSNGQLAQKRSIEVNQNIHTELMRKSNTMTSGIYFMNVYDQNKERIKTIKFIIQ